MMMGSPIFSKSAVLYLHCILLQKTKVRIVIRGKKSDKSEHWNGLKINTHMKFRLIPFILFEIMNANML